MATTYQDMDMLSSIPNAKWVRYWVAGDSTGEKVLYKAPSGKRAYIVNVQIIFQVGVSQPTYLRATNKGVGFRLTATTSGSVQDVYGIVLEPNDTISGVVRPGCTAWVMAIEYDASYPLYTVLKKPIYGLPMKFMWSLWQKIFGWSGANTFASVALTGIGMSGTGQYITVGLNVATPNGGPWYSSDYGVTFNQGTGGLGTYGAATYDIKVSDSGQYQYCIQSTSGQIFYSSDYGHTWTAGQVLGGGGYVSISRGGQYVVAISGTSVYLSTNYGVNFSLKTMPITVTATSAAAISSNGQIILVAASVSSATRLIASYDGGTTWTAISTVAPASPSPAGVGMLDDGSIGVLICQTSAWKSTDGCVTWFPHPTMGGSAITTLNCVSVSSDGFWAFATTGTTYFSNDAFATWNKPIPLLAGTNGKLVVGANGVMCLTNTGTNNYGGSFGPDTSFQYGTSSNYLMYTVPSCSHAEIVSAPATRNFPHFIGAVGTFYMNDSAIQRSIQSYLVPVGGGSRFTNLHLQGSTTVSANSRLNGTTSQSPIFLPGDKIYVASDAPDPFYGVQTDQAAWFTVRETP